MTRTVVINGSPLQDKGDTAMVVAPFVQGMVDAGSEIELVYANRLTIKPCDCGTMDCWYRRPGTCVHRDDMDALHASLRQAEILVLATPVYVPLPGAMQDLLNRLCPLIEPLLEIRDGRTRARFREDVGIHTVALVSTGGWWEKGNFETVTRIAEEFARNASVGFAGAALRPHAFLMRDGDQLTAEGMAVSEALRRAGGQVVKQGTIDAETLEAICMPLVPEAELLERYNRAVRPVR